MSEENKFTNEIVLQQYRVTMARHELSAIEMRIMAMVILKIKDAQLNGYNDEVRDTSDLFTKFNEVTIKNAEITVGSNHSQVKKALKDLRARDITLRTTVDGKPGELYTGLIEKAKYSDDASTIKINICTELLPELVEIGKNYTKFGLEFLFKTKSTHAIRWYQIGSHWLTNGVFYISKEEIRELFKAQKKYKVHKDFQRRLLTEPLEEVNEKSDINLNIAKTHKEGRSIVGYTVSVKRKAKAIEHKAQEDDLPIFLQNYVAKYWRTITAFAQKSNYDYKIIREKLKQRGVPEGITSQKHYDNATTKFVATILSKDGITNLTVEQLTREIKG